MALPEIDFPSLTDSELDGLGTQIAAEQRRRYLLASATTSIIQIQAQYLAARDGTGATPAWVQPTGAMDAYPTGYIVTHGGKTWVALADNTTGEPGVSGWREQTAEGAGPAEWVQPSGATDAYALGAEVTHNGKTWVSKVAANVWEPGSVADTIWSEKAS